MSFEDSWAVVYAGFWRRLGALLVDVLVWLPISYTAAWLTSFSKGFAVSAESVNYIGLLCYQVYFHARWGQSLGKMAARIRVIKLNGKRIGLKEAVIRSSVDLIWTVFSLAAWTVAVLTISDSALHNLGW